MVATRFAVAVHLMMLLAGVGPGRVGGRATGAAGSPGTGPPATGPPATSGRLAGFVNTNPVVVRRIAGQLSRAGLVRVRRGPGGAELARPAETITLDDIWLAVRAASQRPLIPLHAAARPSGLLADAGAPTVPDVAVHDVLAEVFGDAEASFRASLGGVTLLDLVRRARPVASQPAAGRPASHPPMFPHPGSREPATVLAQN